MTALAQGIQGEFHFSDDLGVLVVNQTRAQVCLRYALIELSAGSLFFPELLLDDWGHEIRTLELYRWIRENGTLFPRAEVFGYDFEGNDRQYYLRELDLLSGYPCYGYANFDEPLREGLEINFFVMAVDEPIQVQWVPDSGEITWPMSNAAVRWWQVNSKNSVAFAKSLLIALNRNDNHAENAGEEPD
ncbi:MAG: hypothetical protein WA996_05305 [Candidatus Promineifilaceae bacterium]